jgi:predicted ATPase
MRRRHQVRRGDGCVVLISGEPGIRKSRIAQTIAERISGGSHIRLRYLCSPHHQDSAFYLRIASNARPDSDATTAMSSGWTSWRPYRGFRCGAQAGHLRIRLLRYAENRSVKGPGL